MDNEYRRGGYTWEDLILEIEKLYGELFEKGLEWEPEKIHSVYAEVSGKLESSSEHIASLSLDSTQLQQTRREYMQKHSIEYLGEDPFIIRDPPMFNHKWGGLDPDEDAVHLAMEREFSEGFAEIESEISKPWEERAKAASILALLDGIIDGSLNTNLDSIKFPVARRRALRRVNSNWGYGELGDHGKFWRNEPYEKPESFERWVKKKALPETYLTVFEWEDERLNREYQRLFEDVNNKRIDLLETRLKESGLRSHLSAPDNIPLHERKLNAELEAQVAELQPVKDELAVLKYRQGESRFPLALIAGVIDGSYPNFDSIIEEEMNRHCQYGQGLHDEPGGPIQNYLHNRPYGFDPLDPS